MKYKIGDKIKSDGGDYWFYGTISAVFEHPISPCYRFSVERMVKKDCKFSITQFEFELESDELEIGKLKRQWEKSEVEDLSQASKRSEKRQMIIPEPEQVLEPKPKRAKLLEPKLEKKQRRKREPKQPVDESSQKPTRQRRGDAWDRNFESYQKGEKSNIISTWIANNRKQYKEGNLPEKKFEKLININFPFDIAPKKADNWDKQLEQWKKGERRSIPIQQWRQRSIRQYLEGKLSGDRIIKLREIGILK